MLQQSTSQQINSVIDHLAEKLSVPVSQLWAILRAEAHVALVKDVYQDAIALALIAVGWIIMRRAFPIWMNGKDDDGATVLAAARTFGFGLMFAIGIIAFVNVTNDAIGVYLNPDFFALNTILEAVKK